MRDVLGSTNDTDVIINISTDNKVTLTSDTAINPTSADNITLRGGGVVANTVSGNLYADAWTNKDVAGYFTPLGTFQSLVADAVAAAIADAAFGGAVVAMSGPARTTAAILDSRAGAGVGYDGVHFRGVTFTLSALADLTGGGVAGAYNAGAAAVVGDIVNSVFSANAVTVMNGQLNGGGVAGANSGNGAASIGNIANSVFSGNEVAAQSYLRGGGLVGAYSTGGDASIEAILNSVFSANKAKETYNDIQGGGLVGAYSSNGDASVEAIANSVFSGNEVTANTGSATRGGGLVGAYSSGGDASIGDILNSVFSGNTAALSNIMGGGVVGAYGSGAASIGAISNSVFSANTVTDRWGNIIGGGVAGARSDVSASIGDISDSVFSGNTVKALSGALIGGGVVGAGKYSSGVASIGAISNSVFSDNTVTTVNYLYGGGVVGAYGDGGAIGAISDSLFSDNTTTVSDLYGGGVVGARSNSSNTASVGAISNSVFSDNEVTTSSYFYGGGVVGAYNYSNGTASVGAISDSLFSGNKVTTSNYLYGGGVAGAFSNNSGAASVGAISDSLFSDNEVTASNHLHGGGVAGAFSYGAAFIEDIAGSAFSDNKVTTGSYLDGGGVVGAYSSWSGSAGVGNISDSRFTDNIVTTNNDDIRGGGVVGAYSYNNGIASVGAITENLFADNIVTANKFIYGGGVVGASGYGSSAASVGAITGSLFTGNSVTMTNFDIVGGGVIGAYSDNSGTANVGAITESRFTGNIITGSGGGIHGGGVVGAYGYNGAASVGAITESLFTGNSVTGGGSGILGGGVVGAYSDSSTASVGNISKSLFTHNTIEATSGDLWGGLIYTADDLTLADSTFTDNTFTFTSGGDFYGTVSIDTSKAGLVGGGAETHTVTLRASSGQTTLFRGNVANDTTYNSLAFVNLQNVTSAANAALKIEAASGGTVALYDPIKVLIDSRFDMDVNVPGTDAGDFLWGGVNSISTGTAGEINLNAGKTTLLYGFELDASAHTVTVNDTAILSFAGTGTLNVPSVTIASGGTLGMAAGSTLLAAPSAVTVASGAAMTISGRNSMTVNTATLSGTMHFILNDASLNNAANPLLQLTATSADIGGSTVTLGLQAGSIAIPNIGDSYSLIASTIALTGTTTTTAELQWNPLLNLNFDILKINDDKTLVAQLRVVSATAGSEAINEGAANGPILVNQGADLLVNEGILAATRSTWTGPGQHWFGVVNGEKSRYHTGSGINTNGVSMLAGKAVGGETSPGYLTLGGFIEHGSGHYDLHNSDGKGRTHYTGGGILARLDFNETGPGHFYAEADARAGRSHTSFHSDDLATSFKLAAPYRGAHAGLGYLWNIGGDTTLETYGKYLWARYGNDSVTLFNDQRVKFKETDSRRARGGVRLSRPLTDQNFTVYAGAAREHESDGAVRATIYDNSVVLEPTRLKGHTNMVETGLRYDNAAQRKENPEATHLSVDFGVQSYTGKRDGTSGTLRVQVDF